MLKAYRTPKRRHTIRRRFRIGPTIGRILAATILGLLAVVALTQSTGREATIYEATALRADEGSLQQEINELKLMEVRAKTLETIAQAKVKEEMVPIGDDVEYLDATAGVAGATTETAE